MTHIYLVRHGPTHAKSMIGWSDLPADLSDTDALARLDAYLPNDAVVISSDLSRTIATADAIQKDRPRLDHDANLREMYFGDWELKTYTEVEDQEHIRAFWDNPGDVRPPNGESWNDVCGRVNTAIDRLILTHAGQNIILVAHFGVIITQIQRALSLTGYEAFGHKIDNLSVTDIRIEENWQVGKINHVS